MLKRIQSYISRKNIENSIERSSFKNKLLDYRKIPILEEIILETQNDFDKLKKEKKGRDLVLRTPIEKKSKSELEEALFETSKMVNEFLKIDTLKHDELPNIGRNTIFEGPLRELTFASNLLLGCSYLSMINNYESNNSLIAGFGALFGLTFLNYFVLDRDMPKFIEIKDYISVGDSEKKGLDVKYVIGHEYTHYLLNLFDDIGFGEIIEEGFIRGVERGVLKMYKTQGRDTFQMEYNIKEISLKEYYGAYIFACEKLHLEPKKSLMIDDTPFQKSMMKLNCHSIGNSIFTIHEKEHGSDFYSEIIKNKFYIMSM